MPIYLKITAHIAAALVAPEWHTAAATLPASRDRSEMNPIVGPELIWYR